MATLHERLVTVARYIESHASDKLTLDTLAKMASLSPSRFQKSFKAAFGVSPKAYQDAARMQQFKLSLKEGDSVTGAIYSAGFGSVSRIYGESNRSMGMSPKSYRSGAEHEIIYYACRHTAFGLMMMGATPKGVCFVEFGETEEALHKQLHAEFPHAERLQSAAQSTIELDAWIEALNLHISDSAPRPDLPLDMRGTAFQIQVWQFLLSIKEGDVVSYSDVANKIEKPKAVRAVASACGKNKIGILIPCHRVLRSDGTLGGYRWGLERKKKILANEKAAIAR